MPDYPHLLLFLEPYFQNPREKDLHNHLQQEYFSLFQSLSRMKIAVIGQSLFGADVYRLLQKDGHKIVGVFTVPDVNGKPDPLGKGKISNLICHFTLSSHTFSVTAS